MTQDNLSEFARLCALMGEAFRTQVNTSLIEIYFRMLKDFSIRQVTAAVEQAIATKKFFPKVAELRELIEGNPEDRAAQAWTAFLEAAANGGQASVRFEDRATAAAMDAVFGSWLEACRTLSAGWVDDQGRNHGGCSDEMLASYQKSFLRQYAAALNNNREVELYRAGLSELSMREQGAAWAARIPTLEQPVLYVGPGQVQELRLTFDLARGQLTDMARAMLDGGWAFVQALAAVERNKLQQAQQRKPLLPLDEELATPEEVAQIHQAASAMARTRRPASVVSIADASGSSE